MNEDSNYLVINQKLWDERVPHHLDSEFYDQAAFLNGAGTLKEIELALLGDVDGKSVLHLQCHFGQDTLSLARMGATVTGVDFSEAAIKEARAANEALGLNATFICCDVYSLPEQLSGAFDLVFITYGTIGWLPDLKQWAKVVAHFLKAASRLVFAEFHPAVWMFDDDFTRIVWSYFNKETIVETQSGTYAEAGAPIAAASITWNHPLTDVIGALLSEGLALKRFEEYDYSPYNCFRNMTEVAPGRFQIEGMEGKLPMVYALVAERPIDSA